MNKRALIIAGVATFAVVGCVVAILWTQGVIFGSPPPPDPQLFPSRERVVDGRFAYTVETHSDLGDEVQWGISTSSKEKAKGRWLAVYLTVENVTNVPQRWTNRPAIAILGESDIRLYAESSTAGNLYARSKGVEVDQYNMPAKMPLYTILLYDVPFGANSYLLWTPESGYYILVK